MPRMRPIQALPNIEIDPYQMFQKENSFNPFF
jgi:hypothetical protein